MYRYLDTLVVRAAVCPVTVPAESWPDLIGDSGGITTWRPWLQQTLQLPGFADALEQASPVLTRRVREICAGRNDLPELKQRQVVLSMLRYRLRASGRATPFGLFAGVAAARVADAANIRIGDRHQPLARAEAGWLTSLIRELEADAQLRLHLQVQANNMIIERDGLLVLEHCPAETATSAPVTVSVRATAPIRAALRLAREPIRWADLADTLVTDIPGGSAEAADRLLTHMAAQRLLLTSLRPAMTETDPLAHLINQLRATPGNRASKVAGTRPDVAVDLRADWDMRIPHAVAAEAATAASVLARLARLPHLSSGWVNWHGRFLERYGPRALMPIMDVVDADTGLGYPAGYLGSTAAAVAGALTDRDRRLLAFAQRAALRGQREIVLDDATLTGLALGEGAAALQPTTELTVHIAAATQQALTRGDFTLTVLGVSRAAGTSVGRFLPLFDAEDQERARSVYASLPTAIRGALRVQISIPPLHISTQNVARAPRVLGHVLPLGEFQHGGDDVIVLEDLAVTADRTHLYLVSLSRRQVVAPMLFNAVGFGRHTHPLARFLVEVGTALATPCTEFDWGAAAALPFLPALRYERTILAPARWRLTADDLPGPDATWQAWQDALAVWRQQTGIPARVGLTEGDRVLHLDLDVPAHWVLLRAHLDRTATAVLVASPAPDADGWACRHVAEVVIPLAATSTPPPAPAWLATTSTVAHDHGYLPCRDGRFFLKLYGHPDRQTTILARHLPHLHAELAELGMGGRSWFLRYHDPDHHLRLRVTVPACSFAVTAGCLAAWSERLRQADLVAHVQWDTYFPETARFGGPQVMGAAEEVFAADSAAALAQLQTVTVQGGPDLRAITAAGMLDLAIGWLGDTGAAMRWLIVNTRPVAAAPARTLYNQAVTLANPYHQGDVTSLPNGENVTACWERRRAHLAGYRDALQDAVDLLPDLLHLNHARVAGTDPGHEALCLHLARAAALSWSARDRRNV